MRRGTVLLLAVVLALVALATDAGTGWLGLFGRPDREPGETPVLTGDEPAEPGPGAPTLAGVPAIADALRAGPVPMPVDLDAVDRDLDLHGVVVGPDGAAVAGAIVQVVTYPWRRTSLVDYGSFFRTLDGPRTRSATDGTFAIRLARGERVSLRVEAAGFAAVERRGCTAGQRLRVALAPGVSVLVNVRDESGRPVDGTPARLFRSERSAEMVFDVRRRAGEDGRVRFDGLPPGGPAYLELEPERLGGIGWRNVELPASGETSLDVVLPAGRTIRGNVVDVETGRPIPGARVGINWVQNRATTTAEDGSYRIDGWNEKQGADDLHATAEGYGRAAVVVEDRETVDFRLERGDEVLGRVVDASARPLAGVRVATVPIGPRAGTSYGDLSRTTESGTDGRFRLTSVKRDLEHALVFMAAGHGRTLLDFAPRAEGPGRIDVGDVTLPAARRLEGRLLGADGEPRADVLVTLHGANADRRRLLGTPPDPRGDHYGTRETAFTDDLGRFRFGDLAAGEYRLTARVAGREDTVVVVDLTAEDDVLDAEIRFAPADEILVRVRDAEGDPIAGAYVSAHGVNARTDAAGDARLSLSTPASTVNVQVLEDGDRRLLPVWDHPVPSGAREVEVVLREARTVSGRVVGPTGEPVGSLRVVASVGEEQAGSALTDADGRFSLAAAKGATVDLKVVGRDLGRGLDPWTGGVRGVAAGTSDVVVEARPVVGDRSLEVLVLSPEGTPAAGVPVHLYTLTGLQRNVTTDERGRATATGLTPQPWSIVVMPDGAHAQTWLWARVESVVPEGREVVARFRVAAWIEGVVLGPRGAAVAGAEIEVRWADAGRAPSLASSDAGGRFRLMVADDEPMPLRLLARSRGSPQLQAEVELTSLPAEPVTLRLRAP